MKNRKWIRKGISTLLALTMVLQYTPLPAFAATTDNLCDHHTEHTAECGYREGSEGSACTHKHSEACYKIVACKHTHDDTCSSGCTHNCTVESGCITMELDCHHTHGDCGYAAEVTPQDCATCQPVLSHAENCGYVAPVAEVTCTCVPGEDGTLVHTEGCGYVAGVEEVKCACQPTVTHGGEGCTYVEGKAGSPCTHTHAVKVDSDNSCYKLLCSHKDGGHDDACGYVAAVEAHECHYECAECVAALTADETTAPSIEAATEPSTEATEPAPVCDCGTDDGMIHATTCAVYVAPENPVCYCSEKCTEVNEWCDVCGFDYTACTGTDRAVGYAEGYVASVTTSDGTTTYYETLPKAVTAAQGKSKSTLTLLKNIDLGSEGLVITSGTFTIDLNDCTYTSTAFQAIQIDDDSVTLTITDKGPNKTGTVKGGSYGVDVRSGGTLNITGGTITATTGIYSHIQGTINISGGTVIGTGKYTFSDAGVKIYTSNSVCNITGGTIISTQGYGVYSNSGTLNISGNTNISGTSGYGVYGSGTIDISGGNISGGVAINGGTTTISGGSISGGTADLYVEGSKGILKLTFDEGKTVGATFPGGITFNTKDASVSTLAELLVDTATYWGVVDGKDTMLTVADDATSITDKGDITIRAICDHSGNTSKPVDNENGTHSITCTVCQTAVTEDHTLTDGACNACDYVCPHSNFDSATGNCKDCEISLAIAKIKTGETTIYYQTADDLRTAIELSGDDQAITLLADLAIKDTFFFNANGTKNTLDLNGYTLICSDPIMGRILLGDCELAITGTGSINVFMGADSEGSKIIVGRDVTLNSALRSAYGGVLDLTNATIPEAGLNVILYSDDWDPTIYNVSDVLLLPADYYFFMDGKAVYTYSGETEGTVLKHTEHSYTYTDNGDGTHKYECSICGDNVIEAHKGGTATCTEKAKCQHCSASYGEVDTTNHDSSVAFDSNGFCPNGCYQPAELKDGYYQIKNAGNLYWFAQQVNGGNGAINGKLTTNIVVNQNVLVDGALNSNTDGFRVWTPIGYWNSSEDLSYYVGTFDGAGFTVSGLYHNDSTKSSIGLFGAVSTNGIIKNVGVVDSYFCGEEEVGGVVGYNYEGNVQDCYNTGIVSGNTDVGGVVGYNTEGTVQNCYNMGTVRSDGTAGGVVGLNWGGLVTNCHNTGAVKGGDETGGVVGYMISSSVELCYNTGTVNGKKYVGGIFGYGSGGNAKNCYNTGMVSGSTYVGGVVGYISSGTVENCYNANSVSGSSGVGGVVGEIYNSNTGITKNSYFDSTKYGGSAIGGNNAGVTTVEGKTTEQFASGEVAYLLGDAFGQNISTESYPVLGGTKVYYGYTSCGDTEKKYTNDENTSEEKPAHTGEATYTLTEDGKQHIAKWSCCGTEVTEDHTGGTATCTHGKLCEVCGYEYDTTKDPDNHTSENYTYTDNGDGKHTKVHECNVTVGEPEDHTLTYSANDDADTITESCDKECGHSATITLKAPTDLVYDGEEKVATVEGTIIGDFEIIYSGNTNVGPYTASITMGEATASVVFTIGRATPTVQWDNASASVNYTGSAAVITTPTVTLVNGETFSGTISYSYTGTSSGNGLPINAGTYEITASIEAQGNYNAATSTNKLTLTIAKANASCTAPQAVSGLTYNGSNQNLITAGTATGGTMQYRLSQNESYAATIPTGKDAGTYTVYYKVVGDSNHNDTVEASVEVTIDPKTVTNPVIEGIEAQYLHTGSAITPVPTAVKDGDTVIAPDEYTVSYENNINEGMATLKIVDAADGNYTVSGSKNFQIVVHEHAWTYTAEGHVITAKCSGTIGTCPVTDKTVTLTLTAPENLTYDGTAKVVTVSQSLEGIFKDVPAVTYSESGNVNAGKHTASLTYGEKTATLEFAISAATLPTASLSVSEADYSGSEQKPTVTIEGLKENVDYTVSYSEDMTNAGVKTVIVEGKGNYTGEQTLTYTIKPKEVTIISAEIEAVTYDPNGYTLTVTSVTFGGVVEGETLDYTASAELKGYNGVGTQGTEVTVTLNDGNYVLEEATILGNVTINKAASSVTAAPVAKTLTYTGEAQALVNAGTATGGTMVYSLDEKGEYTENIPTGKNAGSYTVWYYVQGDDNHADTAKASIKVTIHRAPVTFKITDNVVLEGTEIKLTVTSEPANVSHEISYRQNGQSVSVPAAVGEYDVYVTITDSNYRHATSTDGSALKVGVLSIYKEEAPKTYTLSYTAGGASGTMDAEEAALAGTVRILPECAFTAPKDANDNDMLFVGWSDGTAVYQPGEKYVQPEHDVTMTAVWQAEEHNISGMVKQYVSLDSTELVNRGGVTITLMLGSRQITQAVTDENGNYKFEHCLQGTYNLIAEYEGIKQTIKVVLRHSDQTGQEIDLPAAKTNTAVAVQPGTPAVVVGGMDDMMTKTDDTVFTEADKDTVEAGGEVEIKMDIKENPAPANKAEIDQKVEDSLNTSATVELYIDLDLTKTVRDANGTEQSSTAITESNVLLENIIFLPGHLQGKDAYHVFRQHGNDVEEMKELPAGTEVKEEGFVVDRTNHTITIYSRKYSTFAIVTSEVFTITFDAKGGTVNPATMETEDKLSSLPEPMYSGFAFKGWFMADGTEVDTNTVFTQDTTVYAQWERVGYQVELTTADTTGTIKAGSVVEIDGKLVTVDSNGEIWLESTGSRLMTTYTFTTNAEGMSYPTSMYVWNLEWTGDNCKATRISELDNFMLYQGTSIRINYSSDGIRFFTAVPADRLNKLMGGTLLTGDLAGYKLVEMGTTYMKDKPNTMLTTDTGIESYVYGNDAGSSFRVFSKSGNTNLFTGMLVGLDGNAATLSMDIVSRPYAILQKGNDRITIYGGSIVRSVYDVALQNKDTWAAGTDYDNYVEKIISTVETANG